MRTAVVVVMILLGLLVPTRPAAGQSSMGTTIFNDESTFSPELSRADLDVFKRVLSLKPDEVKAMEDLYGAYCMLLKTEGLAVRSIVAEIQEESEMMEDQRILKKAQDKLRAWEKRSAEIKKSFMDDLRSLLTRDQESRWSIVERELRRLKGMSGRIPGEDVDVIKLIEGLPASDQHAPGIEDLMERYSQELDRVLVARQDYMTKHGTEFDEALKADPPRALQLFQGATKIRIAVADVNAKYVKLIQDQLSPLNASKLKLAFFKQSNDRWLKPTKGQNYIEAAKKLPTLTADQKAQVDAIVAEYDASLKPIVERMAELHREWAESVIPHRVQDALNPPPPDKANQGWSPEGLPEDHPMSKQRRSRYQLERTIRQKLDAFLTPDQRSALPDQAVEGVIYRDWTPWGL